MFAGNENEYINLNQLTSNFRIQRAQFFNRDIVLFPVFFNNDYFCPHPEFQKIAMATAIGFAIMGFIGFFVKLIHIPINNIIV